MKHEYEDLRKAARAVLVNEADLKASWHDGDRLRMKFMQLATPALVLRLLAELERPAPSIEAGRWRCEGCKSWARPVHRCLGLKGARQ